MDEPLEIRLLRFMNPNPMAYTLPRLADDFKCPLGQVRAAMTRLQQDGLIEKWRVDRNTYLYAYFYQGQKTATWYRLTKEGRKLHRELRND